MRVFMLGWEFPPFISGGLGTAAFGLTRALSELGAEITFVLPRPVATPFSTHLRVLGPPPSSPRGTTTTEFRLDGFDRVSFRTINANLTPYLRPNQYGAEPVSHVTPPPMPAEQLPVDVRPGAPDAGPQPAPPEVNPYAGDLFAEVQRYAALATELAHGQAIDVVHAHDWMTFPAGLAVAAARNVPLVVHVHSTEFDRSGGQPDSRIYDLERRGMHAAMRVIAVSHLTRNQITQLYGLAPEKVDVVHNAIDTTDTPADVDPAPYQLQPGERLVLFLGRLTVQKGPEYFLAAAKRVLEVMDNVKFMMAGSGDMTRRAMELAADLGIAKQVLFTGFLRGPDVERVLRLADLYVMPSVSEPFGLAPLEAMSHDVPVIISKQSGVSEILSHVLKVDFWDVDEMANKIVAVLKHPPLARTLQQYGAFEVRRLSWTDAARACLGIYGQAVGMMRGAADL